jgi:hypothetical protein
MGVPSAHEREEYLLLLYFGAKPTSPLTRCVRRAYRDVNRTIHGIRDHPANQSLRAAAARLLDTRIGAILRSPVVDSQSAFDSWHRKLTEELCALYASEGFDSFAPGQGQKWINMVFKYAVTFGEDRISGTSRLFQWLHAPIDNVVLTKLSERGGPELEARWSRLHTYNVYLSLQEWIRHAFPGEAPLAVEFRLWQEGMREAKGPAA